MASVRPLRALPNQGDRVPSLLRPFISNGTIEQDAHQASDLCLGVVRQRPAIFAQQLMKPHFNVHRANLTDIEMAPSRPDPPLDELR